MNSYERRGHINNILRRKVNWIGHILKRNCLLHDAIEGQMAEVTGVGRRRTQFRDNLKNTRRNSELKEEAEDRRRWNTRNKYKLSSLSPLAC